MRSPNAKKTENILSIINIGLLTYADEQFGVRDSFEDFLKLKYNNSMKEFLIASFNVSVIVNQNMTVSEYLEWSLEDWIPKLNKLWNKQ